MYEKLKSYIEDDLVYTAILLIVIAAASFMLGRQSILDTQASVLPDPTISLLLVASSSAVSAGSAPSSSNSGGETDIVADQGPYVASRSGTKYHHLSCPGASQIKESNKIFFATVALAEAAGYSRALNCDR